MTRTRSTKADKKPTWTSLVVEALHTADDFMTLPQLMGATGANGDQMRATLHHLKNSRVIDAMEADGVLWFYLTGEDTRLKPLAERVPEPKGNRHRKAYTRRKPTPPEAS